MWRLPLTKGDPDVSGKRGVLFYSEFCILKFCILLNNLPLPLPPEAHLRPSLGGEK